MPARPRRPRKPIAPEELAAILAYAELESDKAAAEKFGVSERTLQRYRADLRAGKRPELAAHVERKKVETARRCGDLLLSVYERGLSALAKRIEDAGAETRMKDRDLVGAIHILGNQLVTRQALTGGSDDEPARDDSAGAPAPADGRGGPAAQVTGRVAALH